MLDPKRPIQTTENPPRNCRLIGVLERKVGVKTLLLSVLNLTTPEAEVEITLEGRTVDPHGLGCALTFINEPKRESAFWPLDRRGSPYGRGLTIRSFAFIEHSDAMHALEIVSVDGVPTEAHIHAR